MTTPPIHDIVDCNGFEIVQCSPWDYQSAEVDGCEDKGQGSGRSNWGILICRPPGAAPPGFRSDVDALYGVVGPMQADCIREECLGIALQGTPDIQSSLCRFALACGLSIIEKAKLELGDTIVVAGPNVLALSVLVAARRQGARMSCVVPDSGVEAAYRLGIAQLVDELLQLEDVSSSESKFDTLARSSRGKIVYVDTVGLPNLVHSMASRLARFGTLVLCRQEVATSLQIDICRYVHLKSAQIMYWSRPENLEEALAISECYRRAANLFRWERIPTFVPDGLGS